MLDELARLNIRLRPNTKRELLFSNFDEAEIERGGFGTLLIAIGSEYEMVFEDGDQFELQPLSDDVLYFGHDCIDGPEDYAPVVDDLCRLTSGDLRFDDWTDYTQYNLRFDINFIDEAIFGLLQSHLVNTGSKRRFAIYPLDLHSLMICQPPEVNAAISKLTGLGFREVEVAN